MLIFRHITPLDADNIMNATRIFVSQKDAGAYSSHLKFLMGADITTATSLHLHKHS